MPLRLAPEPPDARGHIASALDRLDTAVGATALGLGMPGPTELLRVDRTTLTAAAPHPVYDLDLPDIARGAGLAAARLTSWRYLVEDPTRGVALAELAAARAPAPPSTTFTAFNTGPFVAATRAAILHAETMILPDDEDFELRVLRSAPMYLLALWLAGDHGTNHLIPIKPAPSQLQAGRIYDERELLDALQPAAIARLKTPG